MKRHEILITLTVVSPFLFPAEKAGASDFDKIALRAADGTALVPQDQLRGVLRHALREVAAASDVLSTDDIDVMFGRRSSNARGAEDGSGAANFAPERGVIYFSDLRAQTQSRPNKATRIHVDPDTGAVETGSLFSVELVTRLGCEVSFSGTAQLFATDEDAQKWIAALDAAGSWVSAIGAMKTAGFGEVAGFSVSKLKSVPVITGNTVAGAGDKTGYEIEIDRPFLVDALRAADNVFIGKDIIPGGVIKGALARKLELAGLLGDHGDAITRLKISHARVVKAQPLLPLSLYLAGTGEALSVHDALTGDIADGSIRFQPDWKDDERARVIAKVSDEPVPDLKRDVRTHVEIEQNTGTAKDQELYVSSSVVPDGNRWYLDVDYSAIPEQTQKDTLRQALEGGLWGVGQTGATVRVIAGAATPPALVTPYDGVDDEYAVMLQTDAVMCDTVSGDAFESYGAYWKAVLPECEMLDFFAGQRLAGGYLARRFKTGKYYNPFVLTQAGSVFLLKGNIGGKLQTLLEYGLPAPIINGVSTTWENCPFQPENGYGEIACFKKEALS